MMVSLRNSAAVLALAAASMVTAALAQTSATPATDTQIRAAFAAADVNKDGVVDLDEGAADAILVFASLDTNRDGFLVVGELKNHDPMRFKRADRDGDGKLSLAEVAADRVYEFFLIDVNRNGVVTIDEVLIYVVKARAPGK